jgi:hypothetical protein
MRKGPQFLLIDPCGGHTGKSTRCGINLQFAVPVTIRAVAGNEEAPEPIHRLIMTGIP